MVPTSYSRWYHATCQNGSSVVIDLSRIEAVHLETRSVEMFSGGAGTFPILVSAGCTRL